MGATDKSDWGDGPWTGEPDEARWADEATGLACLADRKAMHGAWCGYVAVPRGHPGYGKDYDDLPDIHVHGGITWAGRMGDGLDNFWWLGFDCVHAGDFAPRFRALRAGHGLPTLLREEYRDLAFVREQCTSLASQLAAMTKETA